MFCRKFKRRSSRVFKTTYSFPSL